MQHVLPMSTAGIGTNQHWRWPYCWKPCFRLSFIVAGYACVDCCWCMYFSFLTGGNFDESCYLEKSKMSSGNSWKAVPRYMIKKQRVKPLFFSYFPKEVHIV